MSIPFEIGKGSGHPHIPVLVNGKGPFTFTLDTGAVLTSITPKLAAELGIEIYEREKAMASGVGGGRIDVKFATVDSIQVGSEVHGKDEVLVIDFDSVLGCFTPGVLGHSFLKNYLVHVNYKTKTMNLIKSKEGNPSNYNGLLWIDFEYIAGTHLITVPVYINNEGPVHLVVDTGSSGTVITPKTAEKLGFTRENKTADVQVKSPISEGCSSGCQGVGGFAPGYAVQANAITAGSRTQVNTTLAVIDLNIVSSCGSTVHDGIIGYPFLKDLELYIDYPNKRIAFVDEMSNN
ncbi:MAG: aspartyl protease family protein [Candidatus Thorarchaeota archaeon]